MPTGTAADIENEIKKHFDASRAAARKPIATSYPAIAPLGINDEQGFNWTATGSTDDLAESLAAIVKVRADGWQLP